MSESRCLVSREDYDVYWRGVTRRAKDYLTPRYDGPERRKNIHDRRWLNGVGGRRRFDRKTA